MAPRSRIRLTVLLTIRPRVSDWRGLSDVLASGRWCELDGDNEIVLSDPPLNLVSRELVAAALAALDEAARAPIRALLIRAEGDAFSAGADVSVFKGMSPEDARGWLASTLAGLRRLEQLPYPTLAVVHRLCYGAGLEIALCCDLIWAASGTQLGLIEGTIGATPFGGDTQRLAARAGWGCAREAVLGIRSLDATTWLDWGVVNRIVEPADLRAAARRYAVRLAAGRAPRDQALNRGVRVRGGVDAADAIVPDEGATVIASQDLQAGVDALLAQGPGHAVFTHR